MRCRSPIGFLVLLLAGCSSNPEREPVIGQAFVGPSTLQIRKELVARAPVTATVRHGERLDVLARRRRFLKIRTPGGAEGWVDSSQLLSTKNMDALKVLASVAAKSLPQGKATVFETLNVHTVPNRQAPSFFQIAPGQHVDVIAHESAPRVPYQPPQFVDSRPVPAPRGAKRKQPAVPPPPDPKPPPLPPNWLALSGHPDGVIARPTPPPGDPSANVLEAWTLVRAADGRAGWVLARMLLMAVPDEVAQYAERARITSFFAIGQTLDRGQPKTTWLWSTLSKPDPAVTFDSLRIFTWSIRRHRYETSFIERNLRGYLPLSLKGQPGAFAGFSVAVQEKNGAIVEREYRLDSYRSRVIARKPAALPMRWYSPESARPENTGSQQDSGEPGSPAAGLWEKFKRFFRR